MPNGRLGYIFVRENSNIAYGILGSMEESQAWAKNNRVEGEAMFLENVDSPVR